METSEIYENLDNARIGEGVTKLLAEEGYHYDEPISFNGQGSSSTVFECDSHDQPNKRMIFKLTNLNELSFYNNVLNHIDQNAFSRTEIPKAIDNGSDGDLGPWIVIDKKVGRNFYNRWDERSQETAGGRAIDPKYTGFVLDVLDDLRKIDCDNFDLVELTPDVEKERFEKYIQIALDEQLITKDESDRAKEMVVGFLDKKDGKPLMLSNGDFQFRNFLEEESGRAVLIDWEAARMSRHETEHCIMYQWLLMWNNPSWQKAFLGEAVDRFSLKTDDLQAMLLMRSLSQAMVIWRNHHDLRDIQLSYFKKATEDGYLDGFLGREPNI